MRYLVYCSYDGTRYVGWQKQTKGISVQSSVEEALGIFFQQKIDIVGCGRTDAGVHGRHYGFHFEADTDFDEQQFIYKINKLLPDDISINEITKVADNFHARFSAVSRSYIYRIHTFKDPFRNQYSWYKQNFYGATLEQLNEVARIISSLRDFASFSKTGSDNTNNICRMMRCEWQLNDGQYELHIEANRFLRGMVRLTVGACINVVEGKIKPEELQSYAQQGLRLPHALSVPSCGLTFEGVKF